MAYRARNMVKKMRKNRKSYRRYKFTEKTLSKRGLTALVISTVSLAACVTMIALSFRSAGQLSIYIASYGILAFLLSLVSLFIAVSSLREENTFRTIPYIATGLSVAAVGAWTALYIGGLLL